MHSQLKKDVANDYSKENTDAYPTDIHKALTLMNKYKPLKLDIQVDPAQGNAFVTGGQGGKKKGKGSKKYLKEAEWNMLSAEAQSTRKARLMMRIISPWQATSQLRPFNLSPR